MTPTYEELQADLAFLLLRARCAGSCSCTSERWTGESSNSLVELAYSGEQKCMPWDRSDYAACVRTVRRLPKHRQTPEVTAGLRKARAAYLANYPADASSLERRRRHQEWQAEQEALEAKADELRQGRTEAEKIIPLSRARS